MKLDKLFNPRSIAVIGASRNRSKIGSTICRNILDGRFRGRLYPVNPHSRVILGKRCYPSVTAIPTSIDLAIVSVPAAAVSQVLVECGKKKIPFAVVVSAGFREIGPEGAAREAQLRSIAKRYRIRILGPNCLGFVNTGARLNASFASEYPREGSISFVSQSGALLESFIDWSRKSTVGIRSLVSLGNQADISDAEILEYLGRDRSTSVIGMYVEEAAHGATLYRVLKKVSRLKPVVVLKAGTSADGQQAARSHTGSLAGSPEVFAALLHETGTLRVTDLRELFNAVQFLGSYPQPRSRDIVVVSNAGGPSIVAMDSLARTSITKAVLSAATQSKLRTVVPEGASISNPIDLMGDADVQRFKAAFKILMREHSNASILVIVTPQAVTPVAALARYLVSLGKRARRTLVASFVGGAKVAAARSVLAKGGVLSYEYPSDAIQTLSDVAAIQPRKSPLLLSGAARQFHAGPSEPLPYAKVQNFLKARNLPILKGHIARTEAALRQSSYPAILKVLARSVIHKATAGGVSEPVFSLAQAQRAYRILRRRFAHEIIDGILVQPYRPGRPEFIIGLKRDKLLGAMVLVGAGGTAVEALRDVVLRAAPVSIDEATRMLSEIRSRTLLDPHRARLLATLIFRVSRLAQTHPRILELDLNPVILHQSKPLILDARIFEPR